jgi:predicted nucleic acid-binding protein
VYLFDTSFVSHAVNPTSSKHAAVQGFLSKNTAYADQYYVSVVTLSEVSFGLELLKNRNPPVPSPRIQEVERRVAAIASLGTLLPVDKHIATEHARVRGEYAKVKIPRLLSSGRLKGKHVELWHEEVPPSQLHISENDLWIAATAVTHDFILVTCDPDQDELRKAIQELRVELI